ncbi:uncharacterized protein LOC118750260 [Rhagoletis pomonella]|uniref:uncharacterized protein LOC118750260 n=1 Tax=Rhagoletis pomonella TaxID=28610 RepID=UPI001786F629|nr:uncharacterized protein LOC118750260 [Rhagoletis pomonella]
MALYMLDKIERNAAAGRVDERDEEDKRRYMAMVEEYEKFQTERTATMGSSETQKRNKSQNENGNVADRKRLKQGDVAESATSTKHRYFSDFARDHLQTSIIDEGSRTPLAVQQKWVEIDVRLSSLVMDYVLDNPEGSHPEFDSSESLRGYRVIKCVDQFSLDFLAGCVAEISDAFDGLKLKLIPAKDIPRRPRARIWLPPIAEPGEKLLRCVKLHNKNIPAIDEWELIKVEEPREPTNKPIVLAICSESLEALAEAGYKIRFGIRKAKVRVFLREVSPVEEDPGVDGAGELLMGVKLSDEPDQQDSPNKSAALEVCYR